MRAPDLTDALKINYTRITWKNKTLLQAGGKT